MSTAEGLEWPQNRFDHEITERLNCHVADLTQDLYELECHIAWSPADALAQSASSYDTQHIGDLVVITGWQDNVQATTVAAYAHRIWPRQGQKVINILGAAMGSNPRCSFFGIVRVIVESMFPVSTDQMHRQP